MSGKPIGGKIDVAVDLAHMKRAIALARRGLGRVEPNPMVGCVLVKGGRVVGEGWHKNFGGPHAEVEALSSAGARAAGATAYVSLEPCAHHGKRPPCAEALIAARIGRVVVGCIDPFPLVDGKGIALLKRAGIPSTVGVAEPEARELIGSFIKRITTGLPWVIAKWAATADGAIATQTGHSQWISSPESRKLVHQLRARVDGIIIGIGTLIADDALLTARDVPIRRVARRIIIDPELRIPENCRLLRSIDQGPVTLAVDPARLTSRAAAARARKLAGLGAQILPLPRLDGPLLDMFGGGAGSYDPDSRRAAPSGGRPRRSEPARPALDLRALLKHLAHEHQATNVLIEGGAATHGAFLHQRLVDELHLYTGPRLLGASAAPRPARLDLYGPAAATIDQAIPLRLQSVKRLGDDVLAVYRL